MFHSVGLWVNQALTIFQQVSKASKKGQTNKKLKQPNKQNFEWEPQFIPIEPLKPISSKTKLS